ncbi:MAG: hypothetical protein Athens071425_617 [Parcubacteria group bacterium Athens0714_25]|nr:MAG: hypothetical protein Athens071425_617 [Parcubacteria group bacterium Athens0714_25]
MKEKLLKIIPNLIPITLMVGLIPIIANDYVLLLAYVFVISISFWIKYEKREYVYFSFGLVIMVFSEWIFVSTGVETFTRNSLLGVMPIWLPVLWAYAFVAMKRAVVIL